MAIIDAQMSDTPPDSPPTWPPTTTGTNTHSSSTRPPTTTGSHAHSSSTRPPTTTGSHTRSSSSRKSTKTGKPRIFRPRASTRELSSSSASSSFRPRTTPREDTRSGVPTPSTPSRSPSVTFGNVCRTPPLCDMSFADTIPSELALTPSQIVTDHGSPIRRPAPDARLDALLAEIADLKKQFAEEDEAAGLAALGPESSTNDSDTPFITHCPPEDPFSSNTPLLDGKPSPQRLFSSAPLVPTTGPSAPSDSTTGSSTLSDSESESSCAPEDPDWVMVENSDSEGYYLQAALCKLEQRWGRLPATESPYDLARDDAALMLLAKVSITAYVAAASSNRFTGGPPPPAHSPLPPVIVPQNSIPEAFAPCLPTVVEPQNSTPEASTRFLPTVFEPQNSTPEASIHSLPTVAEPQNSTPEASTHFLPTMFELRNSTPEASIHSAPEIDLGRSVRRHMRCYSARSEPQFSHYSAAPSVSKPNTFWTWKVAGGVAVALAGICAVAACRWF